MAEDKTEVEVAVNVRPLMGHWKPVGCIRKQKEYKENLRSNGGLDSSVWKASKKADGLMVSVSQSFQHTIEKEEISEKKKPASQLQCLWEASENHGKAPISSETTSTYKNASKLAFSETDTNSSGSNASMAGKDSIVREGEKIVEEKPAKDALLNLIPPKDDVKDEEIVPPKRKSRSATKVPEVAEEPKEEKKWEVAAKRSEDKIKLGSEEVNVAIPEANSEVSISEWKCWLLLALFISIVVVYRNMIADMLED